MEVEVLVDMTALVALVAYMLVSGACKLAFEVLVAYSFVA